MKYIYIRDGKANVSCLCDGTLIFQNEIFRILNELNCTNIKIEEIDNGHRTVFFGIGDVPNNLPKNGCLIIYD